MGTNGERQIQYNPQEKALSSDLMRQQAFGSLSLNELMRWMMNVTYAPEDTLVAGTATEQTTVEAPLRAEVIGGLLMRPTPAATTFTIDPGLVFMIDVDAVSDFEVSPYRYIRDPGIPVPGALTFAPSTNGGIRIDILECQRVSGGFSVIETDNRDVFNEATGLFSPQTVNKVTEGRLQYRVRQGVDGGGFPGVVPGWLPLVVASIPNGSVNNDTVTFWDVRPLVSDRVHAPFNIPISECTIDPTTSIDASTMTGAFGIARAQVQGRRVGGRLCQGTPHPSGTGDDGSIDLTSAENQEPGFAPVALQPWYLYLVFPFGLPRWSRYSLAKFITGDHPLPRQPRAPTGISVMSMKQPFCDGSPITPIGLPSITGLVGSATIGVAILSGIVRNTGVPDGSFGDAGSGFFAVGNGATLDPDAGGTAATCTYTVPTGQIPGQARAILCEFTYVGVAAATAVTDVAPTLAINGFSMKYPVGIPSVTLAAGTPISCVFNAWVELPPRRTSGRGLTVFTVNYVGSNVTFTFANMRIMGWRF